MGTDATKVSGGCLCGRVRYEAEVFLTSGYLCHCTICQKSTGQPAEITVLIKAGTLKYLTGEPKYYVSSTSGKRAFCSECGSRLSWQSLNAEDDWQSNLTVGCLDNAADARVAFHMYADTQLPWYRACENLPKFTEKTFEDMMAFMKEQVGRE
jgi:hypothetical protein